MIEDAGGGPTPDPEDGPSAATSGGSGVPAAATDNEASPEWLDAATQLLGRDPDTGLVDTDRALDFIGWFSRQVFSHAKTDRAHHTKTTLLEQIQSAQAVMNSINAVQHVRVAQYAATAESPDPDFGLGVSPRWSPGPDTGQDTGGQHTDADATPDPAEDPVEESHREHVHPLGHVCEFTDVDLAPIMCWGPFQAVRHIDDAVDAVAKTPRLLDEMGAGRLDAVRVAQVTGELIEAGDDTCSRVQDRLLEKGLTGWTSRQAKNRAQTLVRRFDPAAAKQTRKKRVKDQIGSFTRPGPETGLTEWTLVLPTKQALPAVQAVEDLARQLHHDQTGDKTLGECRVDALCDLLLGHAEVSTTINVLVPVKTTTAATNAGTSPGTTQNGTRHTGSSPSGGGAWPVPDSWVEAMMTDYNWDAALQHMVVDLEHADLDLSHGTAPDPGTPDGPSDLDPPGTSPGDPPEDPLTDDAATDNGKDTDGTDNGVGTDGAHDTDSASDTDRGEGGSQHRADAPPDDPPPDRDARARMCLPDVEVPGLGVIPADAIQDMLRTLGTRLTRSLVDWRTGTLIETGCNTYRPTATIRRHVLQRDLHCRFPGCSRPAKFCDVDHVIPWPQGPTQVSNLETLCKHHHRAKHETRWAVTMSPEGVCEWTSPSGRPYTTHPGSLEVTADLHITPGPAETPSAPDQVDLLEGDIGEHHGSVSDQGRRLRDP